MVKAIVEPQGYAQPTKTTNPPEAYGQARTVAEIRAGKRTSPERIVIGLFARGQPADIDDLRAALLTCFVPVQRAVDEQTERETDPERVVDAIAAGMAKVASRSKSGRFMLKGAKGRGESNTSIVESAMAPLVAALLGQDLGGFDLGDDSSDALDELIDITGMRGLAEDEVEGIGTIVPGGRPELRSDVQGSLGSSSLQAMRDVLESATFDDLATSRKMLLQIAPGATAVARNVKRTGAGTSDAFGLSFFTAMDLDDEVVAVFSLILLLQIRRVGIQQMTAGTAAIQPAFDRNAAVAIILDNVPRRLHKYLRPGSHQILEAASDADRADLQAALNAWEEAPPDIRTRAKGPQTPTPSSQ